jgi:hypothetical protein
MPFPQWQSSGQEACVSLAAQVPSPQGGLTVKRPVAGEPEPQSLTVVTLHSISPRGRSTAKAREQLCEVQTEASNRPLTSTGPFLTLML